MGYIDLSELEKSTNIIEDLNIRNDNKNGLMKLDDLRSKIEKTKNFLTIKLFFNEILNFLYFFVVVFIFTVIFINFNLFKSIFETNILGDTKNVQMDILANQNIEDKTNERFSISKIKGEDSHLFLSSEIIKFDDNNIKEIYSDVLDKELLSIGTFSIDHNNERNLELYLKNKLLSYSFDFNLLPPNNRVLIPKFDIDAPIINIHSASSEKLEKGDFDEELYNGVVKYPHTSEPYEDGNMLVFGHTSYYWWKNNPYGEIFAKIVNLNEGDTIQIIWEGKLYDYEVVSKSVHRPKYIADEYEKYKDGKYITLMGCYPIGMTSQRILVVAKQKELSYLSKN